MVSDCLAVLEKGFRILFSLIRKKVGCQKLLELVFIQQDNIIVKGRKTESDSSAHVNFFWQIKVDLNSKINAVNLWINIKFKIDFDLEKN